MADFDLMIEGGTIVDGSGRPGFRGNVGIKDGQVAALGDTTGDATQVIDAEGQIVCPGFVDIHTHYDAQVMWDRMLSVSPWHGVTTVVMGNCGFGVAPMRPAHRDLIVRTLQKVEGMSLEALQQGLGVDWPFVSFSEYFDVIEDNGVAINVAAFVGHTPIRMFVMGEEAADREATDDEIDAMCELVKESIAAGAVGLASSQASVHVGYAGKPVPSRLASNEEVTALAKALGETGEGIIQMTVGDGDFIGRMEELVRESGRPLTWAALLTGLYGPGSHREILERTAKLQNDGFAVIPQVSCRPLTLEYDLLEPFPLEMFRVFAELGKFDRDHRKAAYGDAEFRGRVRMAVQKLDAARGTSFWERTTFMYVPGEEALLGKSVQEMADRENMDPVDLFLDLAVKTDMQMRAATAMMNDNEQEVAELLQDPHVVVALSDAGAHASQLCDACFSTHLLGHWVREKGVLKIEEAVRALTSRPAEVVGIKDRGLLAQGRPADVVVFDPKTVGPTSLKRVNDLPASADRLIADAEGIHAVIVNGVLLRQEGKDMIDVSETLPGRVLRHGTAS